MVAKLFSLLLIIFCLGVGSCGGAVKKEATDTFEDLTKFTTFNIVNSGELAIKQIRFVHIETGTIYYWTIPLYPIQTIPPIPPLFAEMGPILTGWYQIEITCIEPPIVLFISRKIVYGPVILELQPKLP